MRIHLNKIIPILIILASLIIGYSFFANAQESNIVFPIEELGNCTNKTECRTYCDDPENMEACVDFAEKHKIMSKEKAERARIFARMNHIGPGDCVGKKACSTYCAEPENVNVCLDFAERKNLIGKDELKEARKMAQFLKNRETPGGCTDKEECREYCAIEDNINECAKFFRKAQLMSDDDLKIYKKTRGRGPGGCENNKECEEFCNNPDNAEVCFKFAREHDFISEEKIENIREGRNKLKNTLNSASPEVVDCLKNNLGTNIINDIRNDELLPGPEIGERVRECFEHKFERRESEREFPNEDMDFQDRSEDDFELMDRDNKIMREGFKMRAEDEFKAGENRFMRGDEEMQERLEMRREEMKDRAEEEFERREDGERDENEMPEKLEDRHIIEKVSGFIIKSFKDFMWKK